jgi:hypothetical protein
MALKDVYTQREATAKTIEQMNNQYFCPSLLRKFLVGDAKKHRLKLPLSDPPYLDTNCGVRRRQQKLSPAHHALN